MTPSPAQAAAKGNPPHPAGRPYGGGRQGEGALLVAAACALVLFAAPAHAYLDPGAGSMLGQLAAAGFAGVAVLLRLYWGRIKARLKGSLPDKAP